MWDSGPVGGVCLVCVSEIQSDPIPQVSVKRLSLQYLRGKEQEKMIQKQLLFVQIDPFHQVVDYFTLKSILSVKEEMGEFNIIS